MNDDANKKMTNAEQDIALEEALPDDFSRKLLDGALRALGDQNNPMRAHAFAGLTRELFNHILHNAAPDNEVRACSWFAQAPDTDGVTRRQRVLYAAQGGLPDEYVKKLGVDATDTHSAAIKSINELNKATHVRADRVIESKEEVAAFVASAFGALANLLASFKECRAIITNLLEDELYCQVMDAFVEHTFDEIDLVASHGYEVDPFITIDETRVTQITAYYIEVSVSGEAPVTLHYGKGDDAAEISHDFPFVMRFTAPVETPDAVAYSGIEIDDSGWYGADEEDAAEPV